MADYKPTSLKALKETLSRMTWKQRFEHLWEYYKWFFIGAVVIIYLLISSLMFRPAESIFAGAAVNVSLSQEGALYLQDALLGYMGGTPGDQAVDLVTSQFGDFSDPNTLEADQGAVMQMSAMISAQSLDYVIGDEHAVTFMTGQNAFSPVDEVLPAEQLTQWKDRIFYASVEEGSEPIAVALDISELPFVKAHLICDGPVYIAFPGNTHRTERCGEFLDYLANWQP